MLVYGDMTQVYGWAALYFGDAASQVLVQDPGDVCGLDEWLPLRLPRAALCCQEAIAPLSPWVVWGKGHREVSFWWVALVIGGELLHV